MNCTVVTNEVQCKSALTILKSRIGETQCIGLDCEWVEKFHWIRKFRTDHGRSPYGYSRRMDEIRERNAVAGRVSLLQMASNDGYTVLIRLIFFETVPTTLNDFLNDGSVLKIGVNIYEDCRRLYKDWGILVNGWLDLRNIVLEIPNFDKGCSSTDTSKHGLKALGKRFVPGTVPYGQKMRYCNWNKRTLDSVQVDYAGQDARLAVKVLVALGEQYLPLTNKKPSDVRFWRQLETYVRPYINRTHGTQRARVKSASGVKVSNKRAKKEDVEDSSSDIDLDWNSMSEASSCRNAVIFGSKTLVLNSSANRKIPAVDSGSNAAPSVAYYSFVPAAAVSPLLLKLCDRYLDDRAPPVLVKFDVNAKRYIVRFSVQKNA